MSIAQIPAIFTVYVWRIIEGKRQLELHLVAGFNSADAESRIKETNSECLTKESYIVTDERNQLCNYNPAVRCYVNGGSKKDDISDQEFNGWIRTMTVPQNDEGVMVPAGVRRI